MKNLILATTLLSAVSATASAGVIGTPETLIWSGLALNPGSICEFTTNTEGTIEQQADGSWVILNPAVLEMKTFGLSSIEIVSDGKLVAFGANSDIDVVANYATSEYDPSSASGTTSFEPNKMIISGYDNSAGISTDTITVRGTVALADPSQKNDFVPDLEYTQQATATCIQ